MRPGLYWGAAVLLLGAYEFVACYRRRYDATLSMWMWKALKAWPFFGILMGLVIGGLLVHFGWIPAGCDPTKGF